MRIRPSLKQTWLETLFDAVEINKRGRDHGDVGTRDSHR